MTDLKAYSVKEAALLLGCSTKAVYNLLEAKQLDYFTLGMSGRCKRIRAAEIERWQRDGGTSPTRTTASASVSGLNPGFSTSQLKMIVRGSV